MSTSSSYIIRFLICVLTWGYHSTLAACQSVTGTPLNAGLQFAIEQGRIVSVQVGINNRSFVNHLAPVCPAVAALYLIQACHLFQAQNILKTLLEVVWQEGVQDGVGAAVSVAEHHHEVERALHSRGGLDWAGDRGDIENVERQPAEDEHRHHDGHHPGHLALWTLTLCGAHTQSGWLHLAKGMAVSGLKVPK